MRGFETRTRTRHDSNPSVPSRTFAARRTRDFTGTLALVSHKQTEDFSDAWRGLYRRPVKHECFKINEN